MGMSKVVIQTREKFLRNYYLKAKRSVAKATTEGPAAWVIDAKSSSSNASQMCQIMAEQGVEVNTLDQDVTTSDGKLTKGSMVIRMDQPYSRMADMMLDKQYYNPTDPRSYDDTGWEMGALFCIKTTRVHKDIKILNALMSNRQPHPPMVTLPLPGLADKRIALVHTWTSTQDEELGTHRLRSTEDPVQLRLGSGASRHSQPSRQIRRDRHPQHGRHGTVDRQRDADGG